MAYGAFAETKSRTGISKRWWTTASMTASGRVVRGELVKAATQSAGIHARLVLRWKDVRVRRELSGARLRVGKTRWRARRVLRVRVRDAVPQRSDVVEQRSVEIIPANRVKENSRCT